MGSTPDNYLDGTGFPNEGSLLTAISFEYANYNTTHTLRSYPATVLLHSYKLLQYKHQYK